MPCWFPPCVFSEFNFLRIHSLFQGSPILLPLSPNRQYAHNIHYYNIFIFISFCCGLLYFVGNYSFLLFNLRFIMLVKILSVSTFAIVGAIDVASEQASYHPQQCSSQSEPVRSPSFPGSFCVHFFVHAMLLCVCVWVGDAISFLFSMAGTHVRGGWRVSFTNGKNGCGSCVRPSGYARIY